METEIASRKKACAIHGIEHTKPKLDRRRPCKLYLECGACVRDRTRNRQRQIRAALPKDVLRLSREAERKAIAQRYGRIYIPRRIRREIAAQKHKEKAAPKVRLTDAEKLERQRSAARKYYHANKAEIYERFKANKQRVIAKRIRRRLWLFCKRGERIWNVQALIGCSMPFFMAWMESKFAGKMSWQNYGKWHIDHVIPCSHFDLSNPDEQKRCFHYSNLRPMWARANRMKWDSMPKNPQPELYLPIDTPPGKEFLSASKHPG